ncbi:MFS transporter [Aeromicrobium chenweiae]|uniref:MFS transporter n=1 Tax=Aeromicrobium chenweiae TaxID=2079793 RepID=A0A2S0WKL0_9ACTN|nr:MFS transporter [Aeromicrobium chenweiae]AWB91861.1 MFS transporter [Aeromicrobium chenweiae]TGN32708.1 MFS transporter [Aeromicrobium chenweiae]
MNAWAPLHNRVYRMLFIAQLISNIGLWMQTVGAQWFLVEHRSGTAVVALVQTASLLPSLLLALPAGGLADVLDRRRLLIAASTYTVLAAGATSVLAFTDLLNPALLLAMTFLLGCGSALTAPAWQAIQPELVPKEQIPAASALGSVTINAARAVGPAIAGVIVATAGPAAVFAINTLGFLVMTGALLRWRRPADDRGIDRERFGRSMVNGLHYVRSALIVRRIMLRSALFALPASALWALLPVASSEHLHYGAAGYGVVLGLLGAGAIGGVTLSPQARKRLSPNGILVASTIAYAVGLVAVALLPAWAVLPLLLVAGAAWIWTLTTLNASIQLSLAPWVRARGMSVYILVFMGSQAVGSFLWGLLASHLGLTQALLISAAMLAVVAASVRSLPLLAATGTLPRGVSTAWPTPTLVFDPEPDDGPVTIVNTFHVRPGEMEQFEQAMAAVGRARRRTGGYSWGLYRDGSDQNVRVEQFTVPSWSEFQRQRRERWTESDHDLFAAAVTHAEDGPTEPERRLFAL